MSWWKWVRFTCDARGCRATYGPIPANENALLKLLRHMWQVTETGMTFCPRHRSGDLEEAEV